MDLDDEALGRNPFAKVGVFPNRQAPRRFVICAPSRRRGLVKSVIDKQQHPERWAELSAHLFEGDDATPRADLLHELGLVLCQDEIPTERPIFACWLDEVTARPPIYGLRPNPDLVYDWAAPSRAAQSSPAESSLESTFQWGAPEEWLVGRPRVWVPDARTGAKWCYGLRGADAGALAKLESGHHLSELDGDAIGRFQTAGILVEPNAATASAAGWQSEVLRARESIESQRHARIVNVIPDAQRMALARYVRDLVAQGFVQLGDNNVALRYAAHNEGVSRQLHREMTSLVADVFRLAVKPSYSYLASYLPGASLRRHIDRPQSEFSLNILLDCEPADDGRSRWPLEVQPWADRPPLSIYQRLGEGIFYRGTRLPHSRPMLPPGGGSTSLFLEYVPVGFDGPLL